MRIIVFGAGGPTGKQLVAQGLAAGHEVVAVTRRPEQYDPAGGLAVEPVDVRDERGVRDVVKGADAVLSALGTGRSRTPITFYSGSAGVITRAMLDDGVPRLVAVTSAAVLPPPMNSGDVFFDRVIDPLVNRPLFRTHHEDMRRMETLLAGTELEWTVARPAGLFDLPAPTSDRVVTADHAPGTFTARADLAAAMLADLTDRRFLRSAMAVRTVSVRPNPLKMIWAEARKPRS